MAPEQRTPRHTHTQGHHTHTHAHHTANASRSATDATTTHATRHAPPARGTRAQGTKTPAWTRGPWNLSIEHPPQPHPQPPETASPNRFDIPRDRSATAPGLPRCPPPALPFKQKPWPAPASAPTAAGEGVRGGRHPPFSRRVGLGGFEQAPQTAAAVCPMIERPGPWSSPSAQSSQCGGVLHHQCSGDGVVRGPLL